MHASVGRHPFRDTGILMGKCTVSRRVCKHGSVSQSSIPLSTCNQSPRAMVHKPCVENLCERICGTCLQRAVVYMDPRATLSKGLARGHLVYDSRPRPFPGRWVSAAATSNKDTRSHTTFGPQNQKRAKNSAFPYRPEEFGTEHFRD